jgi:hypothetical protein
MVRMVVLLCAEDRQKALLAMRRGASLANIVKAAGTGEAPAVLTPICIDPDLCRA